MYKADRLIRMLSVGLLFLLALSALPSGAAFAQDSFVTADAATAVEGEVITVFADLKIQTHGDGFTVTWWTPAATSGAVFYGDSETELLQEAHDVQGVEAVVQDHQVVVGGLAPLTVVYFYVQSGEDVIDNGGLPFKVTVGLPAESLADGATDGATNDAAGGAGQTAPASVGADLSPDGIAVTNRIGIEAGHSSSDAGSLSCDKQRKEADNTLGVANLAAEILRQYGYTVDVFRGGDSRMQGYAADAFVALHNDYCATGARGFKVSRYGGAQGTGMKGNNDASDRLTASMWDYYKRVTGMAEDRSTGHFTNNMLYYYALGWIASSTPGAIIEMGWWSGDEDMLLNQRGILAAGVAESILGFLGKQDGDDVRQISPTSGSLTGAISPNSDRDNYYFSGAQGQAFTFSMNASASSLDSYLYLYGPGGDLAASNDDSGGTRNSLINQFSLPRTGRYRLLARSYNSGSSGNYTLASGQSTGGCSNIQNQYRAEYFTNRSLSGSPAFIRCESSINNDWGNNGPGNGISNDNFSVRWTGRFTFASGSYTFIARADDGVRVYIDGAQILDGWKDQGATEYRATRSMSAGEHEVRMEYYENGGGAVAQLRWQQTGVTCTNQYKAEYFTNRSLSGSPTVIRCENWPVNWDWGGGSPASGIPADNFSARWTARVSFNAGRYTFTAVGDDGVRVYLDGALIVDGWRDQGATEYRSTRDVSAGNHDVRFEYYENGGGALARFRWDAVSVSSSNLAQGRPSSASSIESSTYAANKGNDGNTGTRWSSMASTTLGKQWWKVDLASQSFNRVTVRWEAAYAARYFVGWSNDGTNFTGYYRTISAPGTYTIDVGVQQARYAGVIMEQRAPRMNNYSFWEVEVYRIAARETAADDLEGEVFIPEGDPVTLAIEEAAMTQQLYLPQISQ